MIRKTDCRERTIEAREYKFSIRGTEKLLVCSLVENAAVSGCVIGALVFEIDVEREFSSRLFRSFGAPTALPWTGGCGAGLLD